MKCPSCKGTVKCGCSACKQRFHNGDFTNCFIYEYDDDGNRNSENETCPHCGLIMDINEWFDEAYKQVQADGGFKTEHG